MTTPSLLETHAQPFQPSAWNQTMDEKKNTSKEKKGSINTDQAKLRLEQLKWCLLKVMDKTFFSFSFKSCFFYQTPPYLCTTQYCIFFPCFTFSSIFNLLAMNHLLFHLPNNKHYRAVMMHHVPSTIMKLVNVGYVEWPCIHVNIGFHANPSHIGKHTSPYVTDLKINPLFPIKCNLPTLNYGIIPVERNPKTQ